MEIYWWKIDDEPTSNLSFVADPGSFIRHVIYSTRLSYNLINNNHSLPDYANEVTWTAPTIPQTTPGRSHRRCHWFQRTCQWRNLDLHGCSTEIINRWLMFLINYYKCRKVVILYTIPRAYRVIFCASHYWVCYQRKFSASLLLRFISFAVTADETRQISARNHK